MSVVNSDENLLYGILALQMDFITRDALIAAMNAWVLDKKTPLGQLLMDRKSLAHDEHALLDALVGKHLEKHGGDPIRSLAAVSSIGSAREDLAEIGDPEIAASLAPLRRAKASFIPTAAPNPDDFKGEKRRFKQLRHHAKGGPGIVYVAHDSELTREVALKEIQEKHADDLDSRARFVREAEITGALEHPGIVPVYGLGTYGDGRPYYAMRSSSVRICGMLRCSAWWSRRTKARTSSPNSWCGSANRPSCSGRRQTPRRRQSGLRQLRSWRCKRMMPWSEVTDRWGLAATRADRSRSRSDWPAAGSGRGAGERSVAAWVASSGP
jgi:hypothetical protein